MEYQTVVVAPDDVLLVPCKISNPPDQSLFMSSDYIDRLYLLSDAWMVQTTNLKKCDAQIRSIIEWKKQQLNLK